MMTSPAAVGAEIEIAFFLVTWGHIRPLRCYDAAMTTNFKSCINGFPEEEALFKGAPELSKMYRIRGHSYCKYVEHDSEML